MTAGLTRTKEASSTRSVGHWLRNWPQVGPKPDMLTPGCNPSTQEAEVGELRVCYQQGLHGRFQISLELQNKPQSKTKTNKQKRLLGRLLNIGRGNGRMDIIIFHCMHVRK